MVGRPASRVIITAPMIGRRVSDITVSTFCIVQTGIAIIDTLRMLKVVPARSPKGFHRSELENCKSIIFQAG